MLLRTPALPARSGSWTAWLLFAMPVLLMLVFVALNLQLINFARADQEIVTDASALAAAQVMVNDTMLIGTPANIANLEAAGETAAQQYANYNPIAKVTLQYAPADFTFTTIANPLNPNLQLIQTVQVEGDRTTTNGNAQGLFAVGLFSATAANVVSVSKAILDRRVAGFRPVFAQNIPLVPIALAQADWHTQVEVGYNPPPLPTYTVILGGANASFLQIDTATDSDLTQQLAVGITPAQLSGSPYDGQFVLDSQTQTLSAPVLTGVNPEDLVTALQGLIGVQRAWPLFSQSVGGTTVVVGFIAARVNTVIDNGNGTVTVTLQPTFLSDPSVVTAASFPIDPYLCRVHLTN